MSPTMMEDIENFIKRYEETPIGGAVYSLPVDDQYTLAKRALSEQPSEPRHGKPVPVKDGEGPFMYSQKDCEAMCELAVAAYKRAQTLAHPPSHGPAAAAPTVEGLAEELESIINEGSYGNLVSIIERLRSRVSAQACPE